MPPQCIHANAKRKLDLAPHGPPITSEEVREAVVRALVQAQADGIIFGGVSFKMVLRHCS